MISFDDDCSRFLAFIVSWGEAICFFMALLSHSCSLSYPRKTDIFSFFYFLTDFRMVWQAIKHVADWFFHVFLHCLNGRVPPAWIPINEAVDSPIHSVIPEKKGGACLRLRECYTTYNNISVTDEIRTLLLNERYTFNRLKASGDEISVLWPPVE